LNLHPAWALTLNALVWGTSWWPLRQLAARGLHPLWATAIIYFVAVLVILLLRPRAFAQLLRTPVLWVLLLAAGTTNAAFNWGVVAGDVVRVVLLFYLMPLWTVLFARALLREPITPHAGVRVLLALLGAAIVLWPPGRGVGGMPWPRSLPDWLGVVGGASFALNNVMLRREAGRPAQSLALAMFLGGACVSAALAVLLAASTTTPLIGTAAVPWPPLPQADGVGLVLLMAALFLIGNLALQYGAARLPANVTSVVMLTEVVFAAASAVWLGGGELTMPLLVGGALILLAALLSAFGPNAAH
jgi:drug/metabolite transporter (DMT)-like permease